jgi:hypothetical protein
VIAAQNIPIILGRRKLRLALAFRFPALFTGQSAALRNSASQFASNFSATCDLQRWLNLAIRTKYPANPLFRSPAHLAS